jgi:hypothetical protein
MKKMLADMAIFFVSTLDCYGKFHYRSHIYQHSRSDVLLRSDVERSSVYTSVPSRRLNTCCVLPNVASVSEF